MVLKDGFLRQTYTTQFTAPLTTFFSLPCLTLGAELGTQTYSLTRTRTRAHTPTTHIPGLDPDARARARGGRASDIYRIIPPTSLVRVLTTHHTHTHAHITRQRYLHPRLLTLALSLSLTHPTTPTYTFSHTNTTTYIVSLTKHHHSSTNYQQVIPIILSQRPQPPSCAALSCVSWCETSIPKRQKKRGREEEGREGKRSPDPDLRHQSG